MAEEIYDDIYVFDEISELVDETDATEIPEVDSFVCPEQHFRPAPRKNMLDDTTRSASSDNKSINFISVAGLQDVDMVEEMLKERSSRPISRSESSNLELNGGGRSSLIEKFSALANDPSSYSRVAALKAENGVQTIARINQSLGTGSADQSDILPGGLRSRGKIAVENSEKKFTSENGAANEQFFSRTKSNDASTRSQSPALSSRSSRSITPERVIERSESSVSRVLCSPSKSETDMSTKGIFPPQSQSNLDAGLDYSETGNSLDNARSGPSGARRALHPPPNAEAIMSYHNSNPSQADTEHKATFVRASQLKMENKWVSRISGFVSEWPKSVVLHYKDGTNSKYSTSDFLSSEDDLTPPVEFGLHEEEYIVAVKYKHKCAVLNQRILGSGIEFETSFERSFILSGKADAFFSWDSASEKSEWRAPSKQCIVGLCLGKDWEFDDNGQLEKRSHEWNNQPQSVVLDILGVIIAPRQTPVYDSVVDQLLSKSAVLKIQFRGEGLAVTDWDETREWRKPIGEATASKAGSLVNEPDSYDVAEGPAPVIEIRRGQGLVWTRLDSDGCWKCHPYKSPTVRQYEGWTREYVGDGVEKDISLISRSNVPKLGPWRRVGQKTMGVRVIWMAMRVPLYMLCDLNDKNAREKKILLDVCDGSKLLGFLEASVEEIFDAAFKRIPLQLLPGKMSHDVFRLVLGLRIDTKALPRGIQIAVSCSAGRRQADEHIVEVCRAEWVRNAKAQRFIGYGENSWWQGDCGVARLEMIGAESDGPSRLNLGANNVFIHEILRCYRAGDCTPLVFEISIRRIHGTISPMPQTDYYGEVEATIDELVAASPGASANHDAVASGGTVRSTFPIAHSRSKVACITIGAAPSNGVLGEIDVLAAYFRSNQRRQNPEPEPGKLFVDRAVICNSEDSVIFNASKEVLTAVSLSLPENEDDRMDEDLECDPGDDWVTCFGDVNIAAESIEEIPYSGGQVVAVTEGRKGSRILNYLRRRSSGLSVLGNLIRGSLGNTPRQSPTASPMGSPLIGMAQSRRTAPNSPAGSPLASARPSRAEMESSTLHGSLSGSPLAGVDRDPPTTSLPFARGGATANRRSSTSAIKFY